MKSVILAVFVLVMSLMAPAVASEDIGGIFCEAMADESLYDQRGYQSYKMLLPGKDGWIFRSESDLTTDFSFTRAGIENIKKLRDALKARGMDLVILLTPAKGLMHADMLREEDAVRFGLDNPARVWANYNTVVRRLRDEGLHVVSLPPVKENEPFFYKRDHHWNSYGAKTAAMAVAEYIRTMPGYRDAEKVGWQTDDLGPYEFEGVSRKVFSDLCGTRQPPETIRIFNTVRTDMAQEAGALFGEMENPEIVLLGTSNSTPEPSFANFHGFLREALEADVINMSVSGGGLDTAMISYLNSGYFKGKPAKIAIWEVPGYYDISSRHSFFRQAIPAAYGDCEGNAVAERKGVEIRDNSIIILDRLGDKKISGEKYYLYVKFDRPVRKYLTFDLLYRKDREKIRIRREERYPPDGEYYLSFNQAKKSEIDKIILYVPGNIVGAKVDARICRMPGESINWFGGMLKKANLGGLLSGK